MKNFKEYKKNFSGKAKNFLNELYSAWMAVVEVSLAVSLKSNFGTPYWPL